MLGRKKTKIDWDNKNKGGCWLSVCLAPCLSCECNLRYKSSHRQKLNTDRVKNYYFNRLILNMTKLGNLYLGNEPITFGFLKKCIINSVINTM